MNFEPLNFIMMYREGKLLLPDSKTGPRTVWLSSGACKVLNALPQDNNWVFPSSRVAGPLSTMALFWQRVRAEANLSDVRLHDLRHICGSA